MSLQHIIFCFLFVVALAVPKVWLINIDANITPHVILDTDIGPYKDDVGALSILHSYADQHRIHLRSIMANDRYEGIVPVIEAINRYFNRSEIHIGITKDPNAYRSDRNTTKWSEYVLRNYPHPLYERNDEAENAVPLYRRMLATSDDKQTIIVSIGYLNNLASLLDSGPDEYSHLTGAELIQSKVSMIICMAGVYPKGKEWNIEQQVKPAKRFLDGWPSSSDWPMIIMVGFEAGENLICGQDFRSPSFNDKWNKSPLRKAWQIINEDESYDGCYDEIAALISVEQPNGNRMGQFYELIRGKIKIQSDGSNIWVEDSNANMAYVKQLASNEQILNVMNILMER